MRLLWSCVQFAPKLQFSFISFVVFFLFGYSVLFLFFCCFFFFLLSSPLPLWNNPITRGYHYTYIRCYITLCYIRSAVVLLGLPAYAFRLFTIPGLLTIAISDPILAKDVTLDCSKACICFVHRSRHIYFTSWLNNIDDFRCSTAEIASITTMFWTLSTILCQVYAGYLYHHPWSETQQTGYSMEVTVSLR